MHLRKVTEMNRKNVEAIVLMLLIVLTTAMVGAMVQDFAIVILLAGLTAAMLQPVYQFALKITKNRSTISAIGSLALLILLVLVPLSIVTGLFIGQAVQLSTKIRPLIETIMANNNSLESQLAAMPYGDILVSYQDEILAKSGEIISTVSMFFVNKLSSLTFSGIQFLFLLFLYLYSVFFFIRDGKPLLVYILHRIPLPENDKKRLLDRFLSVTRATVKGTLFIGVIQGVLAGVAMALAGIESALFWSIVMMILSVIPVLGTILVWLPASVFLILTGSVVPGTILLLWCGIVVGNIDNLLRPKLVGQDTGLHELLILFSTLGGLTFFGVAGFLIGPIVAALWVTLWDIFGEQFEVLLSESIPLRSSSRLKVTSQQDKKSSQNVSPADSVGSSNHWLKKEYRRSRNKR